MNAERAAAPGQAWRWGVPLVAGLGALALLLADGNRSVFASINGWSAVTGDDLWACLTALGGGWMAAACVLPFVGRRPDVVLAAVLVALLAYVLVELLKTNVPLARPSVRLPADEVHLIGPALRKNAFPSGHTATAFALAGLLALNVVRAAAGRWALIALATLVGLSRIVVGVHWPLDVLAGAALGWVVALAGGRCARAWAWGRGPIVQLVVSLALLGAALRIIVDEGRYPGATDFRRVVGVAALVLSLPGWWRLAAGLGPAARAGGSATEGTRSDP